MGEASFKDSLFRALEQVGSDVPEPVAPQTYSVGNIENAAIGLFETNDKLIAWMHELGLDPFKGPDTVLGLGLLLMLDVKNNRRLEPVVDADFEWPDEH
jgi:hypothetical protein